MASDSYLRKLRRSHRIPPSRDGRGYGLHFCPFDSTHEKKPVHNMEKREKDNCNENYMEEDDNFEELENFLMEMNPISNDDTTRNDDFGIESQQQQYDPYAESRLKDKIYDDCSLTYGDSQSAILSLILKQNLPLDATEDIVHVINLHLPTPALEKSKYKTYLHLKKIFDQIKKYHFCPTCKSSFGLLNGNVSCLLCRKELELRNSNIYYATIGLKYQLELLFSSHPHLFHEIETEFYRQREEETYSDYKDGEIYKNLKSNHPSLFLTLSFCSDGVQVLKVGSIWPYMFVLNELNVDVRFRNILISGVWSGDKNAPICAITKIMVEEMNALCTEKISIDVNGETLKIPVFPLCGVFDSGARSKFQGLSQYNAKCGGCSFCYQKAISVDRRMVYPFTKNLTLRTNTEYIKDVKSLGRDADSRGVKNVSPLILLKNFAVTENFTTEVMHNIFQGVVKSLASLWFDNSSKKELFGLQDKENLFDSLILEIKPPSFISRRPRSISERGGWKSNEWRNFLYYYSVPILAKLLPIEYFNNFRLLVNAIFILSSEKFTERQLIKAGEELEEFVLGFQVLYGLDKMSYNMHLLLHMENSVRRFGPLWCHSMFPYETLNMVIGNSITGNRHVQTQILKKYLMHLVISWSSNSQKVRMRINYCSAIKKNPPITKPNGTSFPSSRKFLVEGNEHQAKYLYERIEHGGRKLSLQSYDIKYKFTNSYICLKTGEFAKIKIIIQSTDDSFFLVCDIVQTSNIRYCTHIKKIVGIITERTININDYHRQCVYVSTANSEFLCIPPNIYELD